MGNPLPWSENFAIGHEMIDGQHRLLVGLINEIAGAVHAKDHGRLAHLLKMLRLAAEDHVRQENSLLWEIRTGAHEGALRASKSLGVIRAMAETAFDQHIAEHGELLARFPRSGRRDRRDAQGLVRGSRHQARFAAESDLPGAPLMSRPHP
jgi:hypothetical protein